ncbi:hypothetical protein ABFY41_11390 [Acinetobacter haemolyticus]|uniref:hypothetical protein n=1 Tax=Acinetobacter haemolyticus TaxID=29430 RepID=UPI003D1903F3
MKSYIGNAERIYKSLYNSSIKKLNKGEFINLLIVEISKEMLSNKKEVKIKSICFRQGFKNEPIGFWTDFDISLIPNYESKYEFILWLAGFIDKIFIGNKRIPPAILRDIPCEYTYKEIIKHQKMNKNNNIYAYKT